MDDCMDFDGNGTVDPAEEFWGGRDALWQQ